MMAARQQMMDDRDKNWRQYLVKNKWKYGKNKLNQPQGHKEVAVVEGDNDSTKVNTNSRKLLRFFGGLFMYPIVLSCCMNEI